MSAVRVCALITLSVAAGCGTSDRAAPATSTTRTASTPPAADTSTSSALITTRTIEALPSSTSTTDAVLPESDELEAVCVDETQITSLDPGSGSVRWSTCLSTPAGARVVGAGDGRVFVVDDAEPRLVALDASTGGVAWERSVPLGGELRELRSSAGVDGFAASGIVVVNETEGQVVGLDARSGAERWRESLPDELVVARTDELVVLTTSVTSASGVEPPPQAVRVLDRRTGATTWQRQLDGGDVVSTVIASGEAVLLTTIGQTDYGLIALDSTSGDELWRRDATVTFTIDDGVALLVDIASVRDGGDVTVVTVDAVTGQETTSRAVPPDAAFTFDGDVIYVDGGGSFSARSVSTDQVIWETEQHQESIELAGRQIVVVGDGRLTGHDSASGAALWRVTHPAISQATVLTSDDTVVVAISRTSPPES